MAKTALERAKRENREGAALVCYVGVEATTVATLILSSKTFYSYGEFFLAFLCFALSFYRFFAFLIKVLNQVPKVFFRGKNNG